MEWNVVQLQLAEEKGENQRSPFWLRPEVCFVFFCSSFAHIFDSLFTLRNSIQVI
jgi:hypothetical protein